MRLKIGEVLYEKSYMSPRPPPKISLRHDHDWTRGNDELGSTVEQQPVGKLVQQSCGEVQHATFSQLTQPKPKPICDRSGKPDSTEDVFVVKGETSRSHEIDEKGFHEKLCASDRSVKLHNLSENTRVEQAHDGTGQLVERNSSSAHTVKEQFAPEENRDIASFNTDNEFNRAINEENIDFNIPRLSHSTVKQSHGVNVRNLIQKIENHPLRQALQSDLQQRRQFNPFSKESQDMIKAAGNIELCELLDVEPKAQYVCRTGTSASSTARAGTSCEMERRRTRNSSNTLLTSFRFPITTSRKDDPTGTATGRSRGSRVLHREFAQEEMQEERFLGFSRPVHS